MNRSELPPHLRRGTVKEWLAVVGREGRQVSLRGKFSLFWTLCKAAVRVGGVSQQQWRERMETCNNCPLIDRSLWRCRAYDGHQLGCGCYVKYQAIVLKPYAKGCWGKTFLSQDSGIGWE